MPASQNAKQEVAVSQKGAKKWKLCDWQGKDNHLKMKGTIYGLEDSGGSSAQVDEQGTRKRIWASLSYICFWKSTFSCAAQMYMIRSWPLTCHETLSEACRAKSKAIKRNDGMNAKDDERWPCNDHASHLCSEIKAAQHERRSIFGTRSTKRCPSRVGRSCRSAAPDFECVRRFGLKHSAARHLDLIEAKKVHKYLSRKPLWCKGVCLNQALSPLRPEKVTTRSHVEFASEGVVVPKPREEKLEILQLNSKCEHFDDWQKPQNLGPWQIFQWARVVFVTKRNGQAIERHECGMPRMRRTGTDAPPNGA